MTPREEIRQIDKNIDAVTRQLKKLERIKPLDAGSWQNAWDKHPDLHDRYNALYHQRGIAQLERDQADHKAAMKLARSKREKPAKKCPTCGCHTLYA